LVLDCVQASINSSPSSGDAKTVTVTAAPQAYADSSSE